jgi:hypothetical protein
MLVGNELVVRAMILVLPLHIQCTSLAKLFALKLSSRRRARVYSTTHGFATQFHLFIVSVSLVSLIVKQYQVTYNVALQRHDPSGLLCRVARPLRRSPDEGYTAARRDQAMNSGDLEKASAHLVAILALVKESREACEDPNGNIAIREIFTRAIDGSPQRVMNYANRLDSVLQRVSCGAHVDNDCGFTGETLKVFCMLT